MGRAPCCEKVGLKKGKWTAEEDEILTKYIQVNGEGSWRSLPKNAASHLPGRTDSDIKNYWNSHLSRKICTATTATTTTRSRIMDVPPKQRNGRTSRWAMKKNKIYALKTKRNNHEESPKQSVVTHKNHEAVPVAPTPSLESEKFTMVMDFSEEIGDGSSKGSSQQEDENGRGTVFNEQYCVVDDDAIINNMLCTNSEKEKSGDENSAQYQQFINGGWGLNFSEIMDTCFMEDPSGFLSLKFGEEKENNNNNINNYNNTINDLVGNGGAENEQTCTTHIENSVNQSSNGEIGELLYSFSSMVNGLDDSNNNSNCDWGSVMEFNGNDDVSESLEKKENLLTWLWEDDWEMDYNQLGDFDSEVDLMLAWFSS
ncbi:unnamed protein product [Lupinus luteus]|uniref:Uncharacterized protein n=1 Tax=Lupinus luteus TaxID=3873 RepID=A0AAV1W027_LUPLU